jgi:hypothetical protein
MPGCALPNPVCSLQEINAAYPTSYISSDLLPTDPTTLMTESQLTAAISFLKTNGKYPAPLSFTAPLDRNMNEVTVYKQKLIAFYQGIKTEYDYYDARYRYLLNFIITELAKPTSQQSSTGDLTIASATDKAIELNKKMNYIVQVIQAVGKDLYNNVSAKTSEITQINTELNRKGAQIKQHAEVFSKNMGEVELKKRMVEYTQEKARATDNLLTLYFVLNVFALTGLVYVYKTL